VELLAATGAAVGAENPGVTMSEESVRLLERFGIQSEHWVETVKNYRRHFDRDLLCPGRPGQGEGKRLGEEGVSTGRLKRPSEQHSALSRPRFTEPDQVPRTGTARTRLERHIYRGSGPATARNGLSPTAAADARYARSAVSPQIDPQCRHIASASRSRIAIELVFSVQTKVGVSESPWGARISSGVVSHQSRDNLQDLCLLNAWAHVPTKDRERNWTLGSELRYAEEGRGVKVTVRSSQSKRDVSEGSPRLWQREGMNLAGNSQGLSPRSCALLLALSAALGLTLTACTPGSKAYPGPALPFDQVGFVAPAAEEGFRNRFVAILQINGQEKMQEWSGGRSVAVHLSPGIYDFRVEFKQATMILMIPIVDVVTLSLDAAAAASHDEMNIRFPVRAGLTHRIHYDVSAHEFWVSVVASFPDLEKAPHLEPTEDAVQCEETTDQSMDFWCQLVPQGNKRPTHQQRSAN
jgi:hypothetical protein